jgi:prefoldin subunit 5
MDFAARKAELEEQLRKLVAQAQALQQQMAEANQELGQTALAMQSIRGKIELLQELEREDEDRS